MKGYFRKRGDKWSFTVDVGRDPLTGKRKQKSRSGFKTKKEAEKSLNEMIYELDKGTYFEPNNILFKDFAWEWFDNHKHRLKVTTEEQYYSKIKNHIIPFLGHYKLSDIKPVHGQAFTKHLLSIMKQSTAHKVFSITNYILYGAVTLELIQKNPFKNVTKPKDSRGKIDTWDFEELNAFLNFAKTYKDGFRDNPFYYRIFTVAAYTGMRKGEILGLRKQDVDFEAKKLNLRKSVIETKKAGVSTGELKTLASYRQISIDDLLCSILKEQILKNNSNKLRLGAAYQQNGLIFCREDGAPFRPSTINKPFKIFIKKSGVKDIRFHDLRHTHATLLLKLGVNPKIVSERLGHSNVKITLDIYSHVTSDMQEDTMFRFSEKLSKMQ
ncbi:site-specific integrase [Sutcliffiella horikoshii]|uniref:Site-specific integrase n=1 Tax=Sutcliffiella horikoshii TaxID=79883 RepID=A0A5D4T2M1_9BACI|nr:site-specific integrase [Sutcliffiella horikoshii]TYS68692.1 site-specific integrase [Sutcliffiella horikoshii]